MHQKCNSCPAAFLFITILFVSTIMMHACAYTRIYYFDYVCDVTDVLNLHDK